MKDYIVEADEHLSPIVVVTTVLLVGVFALGILYQLVLLFI